MDIDSFETAVDSFKTLYENRKVLLGGLLGTIFVVTIVLLLPNAQTIRAQTAANPAAVGSILVLIAEVAIIATIVQSLLVSFMISATYYPEKRVGELAKMAVGRWPYLIVSEIIYTVVVLIGLVALVIPGIYLAIRLYPYYASVVAGKYGPIDGLKRAWGMTRGQTWAILGLAIIIVVVILVVELAFSAANQILGAAVGGFLGYAQPVAGVLIYKQLSPQVARKGKGNGNRNGIGIKRARKS